MRRVYLDYAAAAPVVSAAHRAFVRALKDYGNPSSAHEEGRAVLRILEEARTTTARITGVRNEHVVFTSGATEANALAIDGHVRALMAAGRAPSSIQLLFHPGAHASVAEAMHRHRDQGVRVELVPLKNGEIDFVALRAMLGAETALISLEAVNAETGQRHDTRAVATLLREQAPQTLLHVDASQAPLVEAIERTRFGADLLTMDAQKVGGVRGIGCLIRVSRASLAPIVEGGGQEGGLRSGTPSAALAAGFAAALAECARHRVAFAERAARIRAAFTANVLRDVPHAYVNEGKDTAPHIVNFSFPGRDTDYLVALMDAKGFAVSAKSACESDSEEGSRAVRALTGDDELARATLRVSWGPAITERDLQRFAHALTDAIRFLDASGV